MCYENDFLFNIADFAFYGIKGDMNCDGAVDVFDYIVGKKKHTGAVELMGLAKSNADMDSNGDIALEDMVMLKRFLLGKE